MDAIAAQAGLTKPTLYKYFASKEGLFQAMMLAPRDQMLLFLEASETDCHVTQLWQFAWAYADIVMRPEYLALARLVIGDATRFPDLGRAYQESGPDRVLSGLAGFMEQQARLNRLHMTDPELAAEDFWGLILSSPRNTALHIPDTHFSHAELAKYVHNGLRVFLRAYSNNPASDLKTLEYVIAQDETARGSL